MSFNHKLFLTLKDKNFLLFDVLSKFSVSLGIKFVGLLAGLYVSSVLSRLIGADGLGIINLSNKIVNILLIVGLFGMQNVIIKNVSISHSRNAINEIKNVLFTSIKYNGSFTIILSIIFILISSFLSIHVFHNRQLTVPLQIALSAMIIQMLSRIYSGALLGLNKVWQSNFVDQALSYVIIAIILIVLKLLDFHITIIKAALIFAISRVFVSICVYLFWKKYFPFKGGGKDVFNSIFKKARTLFFASLSTSINNNFDLILLGAIATTREVGIFSVVAQIALIPRIVLIVLNSALSPQIASLYELGKFSELEKLLRNIMAILFLLGILIFFISFFTGEYILSFWGEEFKIGYIPFLILIAGQLINMITGPTGPTLIMTGNETVFRNVAFFGLLINIIISTILTILFGINGLSIGIATTVVMKNLYQLYYINYRLRIRILPRILLNI